MSVTASDIFTANDSSGNLSFNIIGTNGGGDTLTLGSADAETWATSDSGATYTTTGNFDGNAGNGNETYTINITDIDISSITI